MVSVIRRYSATNDGSAPGIPIQVSHGAELHWLTAGRTAPPLFASVPSIHMSWGGTCALNIDGRPLRLDDEVFLVLNAGHTLMARCRHDPHASLLSVYFAPNLFDEAIESLTERRSELRAVCTQAGVVCLFEHLRDRDPRLDSVMRYIAHHVQTSMNDAPWYQEQVSFLLMRLLSNEDALVRSAERLTGLKTWKRRETFQRLARVTDLIHSAYERPLSMLELADAAHWSVFHTMREFKAAHGVTPYEYLQRRRIQAAVRLLSTTELSVTEVAERVGFHERSTLMRRLIRSHGVGARALRDTPHSRLKLQQAQPHRMPIAASLQSDPATSI